MNNITLFNDKIRVVDGPMDYNGDIYRYYNDSSRPEIANVRKLLEDWFALYPDEEKQDLKSRFKATFDLVMVGRFSSDFFVVKSVKKRYLMC